VLPAYYQKCNCIGLKGRIKNLKQVIIKKSEWLRGEGWVESYLLRSRDNKRCCIGFFCEQILGANTGILKGRKTISEIDDSKEFYWIQRENLYNINDSPEISDEERMRDLKAIAAKHGYDFIFVE
jgi:hypothetical protein